MEKPDLKYSKYCLVPHCISSSIRTPGKIFISLPVGSSAKLEKKRKLWLRAMGRNENDISENTRGFVCEDHFNLEQDMENYMRYKLMGGKIFLKDQIVPHKFECQIDRICSLETTERSGAVKRARTNSLHRLLGDDENPTTMVFSEVASDTKDDIATAVVELQSAAVKVQPAIVNVQLDPSPNKMKELHPTTYSDKYTQTLSKVQRTVSTQYRPQYRSKFVQTNDSRAIRVACSPFKSIKVAHVSSPSRSSITSTITSESDSALPDEN